MKKQVLVLLVVLSLFVFSCEIGLGAAVDVAVPTSGISYPPQNAVVRDTFVAAGSCEDDQGVKSVKVTVIDTESNKSYGPYKAVIDKKGTSWSLVLNNKDTSKVTNLYDSYKQWEFPDGNYIIRAVAYDAQGKSSAAATSPISIDNTAPVFIASKPLAIGSDPATEYGRSFMIAGELAEEHDTAKVSLFCKEYNPASAAFTGVEKTIELFDITSISSSNPLLIAKYYNSNTTLNDEKTKLRKTYLNLYGKVDEANAANNLDKSYYCAIQFEDNAKIYNQPGDSGSGTGNQTSEYYILNEEVSELFGNTYSLDVTKLMQIMNGKSSYSAAQISEITQILSKEGNKALSKEITKSDSSKFNINPNNSPVWSIDGYGVAGYETDFIEGVAADPANPSNKVNGAKPYTAGNILTLSIKAGRDNIYIKPNSVAASLYHLTKSSSSAALYERDSAYGEKILITAGEWTDPAADSASTQISLDVTEHGLKNNDYYEIVVTGEDRNHVSFEPEDSQYVFKLSSNGAAPIIEFSEGLNRSWVSGQSIKDSFDITGKITSSTEIEKDKVTIETFLIKDNNDSTATPSIDWKADSLDFGVGETPSQYPFTVRVTPASGELVPALPSAGSKFTYTITIKAQDKSDVYSLKTLTLFVDNKKPSVNISGITPADSSKNGKITVRGTASDNESGLASLTYIVKNSSGKKVLPKTSENKEERSIAASNSWNFVLDTTELTKTGSGDYTIEVKAVDKVGNEETALQTVHVDQASDTPKLELTNAYYKLGTGASERPFTESDIDKDHNLFDSSSNKTIYGSITDDDGVNTLTIWYKTAAETSYTKKLTPKVTKNGKVASFSCVVPSEGLYTIKIAATDTLHETDLYQVEKEFPIAVNDKAPEFKNVTPESSESNYVKGTLKVNGKIKDKTGAVTITYEHTPQTASLPSSSISQPPAASLNTNTGAAWSDTINLPSVTGKYTVKYTATNKYGQSSSWSIVYSVDVTEPAISSKKINNTDFTGWWNNGNLPLSVVVTDQHSGVSKVEYSTDPAFTNPPAVEMTQSGNTWSENVSIDDASGAVVYIRATDKAGNTKTDSISVDIDNQPPELLQKAYQIASGDIKAVNGTVYVKANEKLTVYGSYSDSPSGVKALTFSLGGTDITPSSIQYSDDEIDDTHTSWTSLSWANAVSANTASWKAEFPANKLDDTLSGAALLVKGADKAGNFVTASGISVTKDVTPPDIVGLSIKNKKQGETALTEVYKATDVSYYLRNKKDGKITISGISADSNISETKLVIQGYKADGSSAGNSCKLSPAVKTVSSWEFANLDMSGWSTEVVRAVATLTAKDKAGNTSTLSLNLIFDEKEPVLHFEESKFSPAYTFRATPVEKYSAVKIGQGVYSETSYGQLSSIMFTFYYTEEGSSFDEIEYQLLTAEKADSESISWSEEPSDDLITGTLKAEKTAAQYGYTSYTYYEGDTAEHKGLKVSGTISGFTNTQGMNKKNLLLVRATDNCGNKSEPKLLKVLVDQTQPVIEFNEYTGTKVNGNILTNGSPVTLSGSVKDLDAGLKALRLFINTKTQPLFEFDTKNPPVTNAGSGLTVTAKKWTGSAYAATEPDQDDAVQITLSNSYGEFTFTGYDSDPGNGPDDATVTVSRRSLNSAAAFVKWTAKITPNSDESFADKKNPYFNLEAEDWAEHSNSGNYKTEKIGQLLIDKTAPEVELTDPIPSAGNPLNGLQTFKGTASDIHELEKVSLYISTANTAPTTKAGWGSAKAEIEKSDTVPVSALYSYKFENIDMKDYADATTGKGKIHVLVVASDIAGNESAYNNSKTYNIDYDSNRPIVTIADISLSGVTKDAPLLFTNKIINLNISDDDGIEYAKYSIIKGDTVIVNKQTIILNGSGSGTITLPVDASGKQIQNEMKLQFFIKDKVTTDEFNSTAEKSFERIKLIDSADNSIADSTLYLNVDTNPPEVVFEGITKGKAYTSPNAASFVADGEEITTGYANLVLGGTAKYAKIRFTATDEGIGVDPASAKVTVSLDDSPLAGSPFTAASTGTNDEYFVIIPCNTGNGTLKIEVSAKEDAAEGMTSSDVKSFTLDNTNPEIKLTGPSDSSYLSGAVTGTGNFNEVSTLYYAISPIPPQRDSNGKITNSPETYTSTTSFSYDYIGNTGSAVALTTAGLYQKCAYICPVETRTNLFYIYFDGDTESPSGTTIHSALLNDWIIDMGITTADAINRSENPFSRIVKLYLYIKAKDAAGNVSEEARTILLDPRGQSPVTAIGYPGENGLTLGGPITLMGTATGKNQISKVYVEISKDGGASYGTPMEATVSGSSWYHAINVNGELDPGEGVDKQAITIRVHAKDNKGSYSGYETRSLFIDKDTPVIGQTVTLVQWEDGYNGSIYSSSNTKGGIVVTTDANGKGSISIKAGSYKALRNYTDKVSLKGKWYIVGTVSDDNGIQKVQIDGSDAVTAAGASYSYPESSPDTFVCPMDAKSYYFCIPIGVSEKNSDGSLNQFVGQKEVDFAATEKKDIAPKTVPKKFTVKIDNKAPVLTTTGAGYKISEDIVNNNGFYTFGSVANEDKVGDVEQTGVDKIAFWFTRATATDKSFYDVMIQNDKTGNKINTGEVDQGSEGLWWKEKTGVTVSGAAVTLTAADENIHVGGLAKINGTIYRITDVQTKVITLNEAPGDASTAYFAIANVIDNPIVEGQGKELITDEIGWGYYKDSDGSAYDDKDNLIESLAVSKTNTTASYAWSANVNSRNLDDGPVDLHYVVFDKAGNASSPQTVQCTVKNNAPRIAGLKIGTDQNGDKQVKDEDDEFITKYFLEDTAKIESLNSEVTYAEANGDAIITVKGKTIIQPEILGGNEDLKYTFTVTKVGASSAYYTMNTATKFGLGTKSDDSTFAAGTGGTGLATITLPVSRFIVKVGGKEIEDASKQKFTFTIKDSTPGRTAADTSNQQTATLNVIMNVALRDANPAKNYIMPFYWKSLTENSVYSNKETPVSVGDLKGHIELPKDLNEAKTEAGVNIFSGTTGVNSLNPKVSGIIKVEGIACDDTLITQLAANINGAASDIILATYDAASTGSLKPANKTLETDGWKVEIKKASYGEYKAATKTAIPEGREADEAMPFISQKYGHVVHWVLTLDTNRLLAGSNGSGTPVKTGFVITVSAKDRGKPTATAIDDADNTLSYTSPNNFNYNGAASVGQTGGTLGSEDHSCKYTMDVVPYILGFKTFLSTKSGKADTSEFDRTALGRYPVDENEEIYIYGFNLKGGSFYDKAGNSVSYGAPDATDKLAAKYVEQGFTVYKTDALSSFTSGKVSVKFGTGANAIESLNNKNYNGAKGSATEEDPIKANSTAKDYGLSTTYNAYNTYFYNHTPNQTTNYILTDDVELDMWHFNPDAARPNASGRVDEPIMKINPSSGIIGFAFLSGPMRYAMPNGLKNSYNGEMEGVKDGDYHAGNGFTYDDSGNAYGFECEGTEGADYYVHIVTMGNTVTHDKKIIDKAKEGGNNLRYKLKGASFAATDHGNSGRNLYMAYYNSYSGRLCYRSGNSKSSWGLFGKNDSGGGDANAENSQVIACNNTSGYSGTPLGNAGKYISMDVKKGTGTNAVNKDIVVLVWYDETANALKYTYNTNPASGTTGLKTDGWNPAKTIFTGGGEYCQVKFDANGGVHIAAKNKKGGVKYAYLSDYTALDEENATVTVYDVDTYGNVGGHLTLDVALDGDTPIPYISYIGSEMPKLAYLNKARGAGSYGSKFTGTWEVSYIPSASNLINLDDKEKTIEADSRVNVGVWKDSSGKRTNSVTATEAGSTNTAKAGSGTCWGNGTANPVAAYQILNTDGVNERIETAQKKD